MFIDFFMARYLFGSVFPFTQFDQLAICHDFVIFPQLIFKQFYYERKTQFVLKHILSNLREWCQRVYHGTSRLYILNFKKTLFIPKQVLFVLEVRSMFNIKLFIKKREVNTTNYLLESEFRVKQLVLSTAMEPNVKLTLYIIFLET